MSREYEIDGLVKELIGKIVSGEATDKDRQEMQHLLAERSRRMHPRGR